MKKNSLESTGLSMSQATSISNLLNQRAREIQNKLSSVNNYKKTIKVNGEDLDTVKAVKIPDDVIELVKEKAKLHACQAFLMENITAKNKMLDDLKKSVADISSVVIPEHPKMIVISSKLTPNVSEDWGWEQLSANDLAEYYEAEAYASHIGQFIHKGSILDNLRNELPTIPQLEWMDIKKDEKTPVKIDVHHTSDELLKIHEDLATLHRTYEQTVNYYKAKVKNLVTEENARISKENHNLQIEAERQNSEIIANYHKAVEEANEKIKLIKSEYEIYRQQEIKRVAALKIKINDRFQSTINLFLKTIEKGQTE